MTDAATVLVVEDRDDVRELYVRYLASAGYNTRDAGTAAGALDALDESVDAVLLDRRLPDRTGPEVLAELRERGVDVRVAMVTAVEPDVDIVDMGFDLYALKPLTREGILDAVETLLARREYDAKLRRSAALVSKRAVLEAERGDEELATSDEYAGLVARIETLDTDLDSLTRGFSADDYRAVFRDLGRA